MSQGTKYRIIYGKHGCGAYTVERMNPWESYPVWVSACDTKFSSQTAAQLFVTIQILRATLKRLENELYDMQGADRTNPGSVVETIEAPLQGGQ